MASIFDTQIPQHVSKVEERIEDDSDDEDNLESQDGTQEKDNKEASAESYVNVLGVRIGYSDAKAIAGMEVVEVFAVYLPENVLGMTDCINKIWIRYGLGYLKKHVLIHEIEHVKDPAASEYVIRLRAKQREPAHYVL
ncbi:MAG: hypothetical protein HY515_02930 [Candidatus Aenigmarchaeota archaeon]|nr:hypothetical protein [Candidatus Aenigmarchaeota archaeon]